jgi:predicted dehydrogenase
MVLTSGSHAPIAIAAAQAHRHVFIEKPIALSEAEGREIIEAGRKAGVRLMVGYMKRYDPAVERLREELPHWTDIRGVITTTLESPFRPYVSHYPLVTGTDMDKATLKALQADDDRRVGLAIPTEDPLLRRVYRRFLLDSMVHDLNLVRGLLGEPDRLEYARLSEDGVVAVFTLQDGFAGYQQEFAFFSAQQRATLVFPSPFLRSMPTQLRLESDYRGALARESVETVSYEEAFKRELVEFHECITADREPLTTAADGVRDIALCQALVTAHLNGTGMALRTA